MVQNSNKSAGNTAPDTRSHAQTNRIFKKQSRFEKAEADLEAALRQRERIKPLQSFIGMLSAVALAPLALLNSVNDAPIMEVLFGISGPDPWISPVGPIQPMAVAISLLLVGAMGLMSLLALADESHASHTSDTEETQAAQAAPDAAAATQETPATVSQNRGRFGNVKLRMPSLRVLIAAAVMFALVGVVGYGGYLRAIMLETGQNPWVSAIFAGALGFSEELAAVAATLYLMYQAPVWRCALRLRWMWIWDAHIPGHGVQHAAVVAGAQHVDALNAELGVTNTEISDSHKTITGIAATVAVQHADVSALREAKKENIAILEAEKAAVQVWYNAVFLPAAQRIARQPAPAALTVAKGLVTVAKLAEETKARVTSPLKKRQTDAETQRQAARSRAAAFDNGALNSLAKVQSSLHTLEQKVAGLPAQRAAILAGMRVSLSSPGFAAYPAPSQVATLALLSQVVIALDGVQTTGAPTADDMPLPQRIAAAISDLNARELSPPPCDSPIAGAIRALNALQTRYAEAEQRVILVTAPEIMAQETIIAALEMDLEDRFACATAISTRLESELAAQRSLLLQRQRAEQRARGPFAWLMRVIQFIFGANEPADNPGTIPAPGTPLLELAPESAEASESPAEQVANPLANMPTEPDLLALSINHQPVSHLNQLNQTSRRS